jgi:hypothetical protein
MEQKWQELRRKTLVGITDMTPIFSLGVSKNSDLNQGVQEAGEEDKDEKKVAQSGNNVSFGCP